VYRARRHGEETRDANVHPNALVAATPTLATIVRGDGRVEMPQRMADGLGLAPPPRTAEQRRR
jgi:hypothetical protein